MKITNKCWFDRLPKQLRILIFLVSLLSCFLLGTKFASAQTSTTTVTVNGNTTTTTTITNTPISSTVVPNTPNFGDITTTTINQTTTDIMTKVANTNSGNLLTGNFCTGGWTGTQITNNPSGQTSDLGCSYLTGKGTSSYAETSKDLLSVGISKPEQNLGFTQSANARTGFYWNNPQSLIFSQSVTNNDTGETITQNRTYSKGTGSDPNYMTTKSLDNIVIGTNSASGYTSKIRFDFSSSGSGSTWQGADITNPNLSITYNKLTLTSSSLETTTTSITPCESLGTCYTPPVIEQPKISLTTSGQTIDEQIKSIPYSNSITGEVYGMTPPTINTEISVIKPQATETLKMENQATNTALTGDPSKIMQEAPKAEAPKAEAPKTETPTATKSEASTTTAMTKEEPKTSTPTAKESNATTTSTTQETSSSSKTADSKSESKSEEKPATKTESASNENKKTEGSSTQTTNEKTVSDSKTTSDPKGNAIDVKVKAAIEKVEKELKSIGDKTKAIQEIKLDGIKAGAPNLAIYENRAFYEPKYYNGVPNPDFYLQADIAQKAVYTNVNLDAYVSKDPIAKQQIAMQQIQDEMNDIIIQLEELKRK